MSLLDNLVVAVVALTGALLLHEQWDASHQLRWGLPCLVLACVGFDALRAAWHTVAPPDPPAALRITVNRKW